MHKGWEQCQNGEDVELRDKEKFCWVHVVPVTKFMSYSKVVYDELCQSNWKIRPTQDSFYFFRLAFFNESIKNDDVFALQEVWSE